MTFKYSIEVKSLLFLALAIVPTFVHACKLAQGYEKFAPAVDSFVAKWDGGRVATLPAPEVKVIDVQRGKSQSDAPCPSSGLVTLDVKLPKNSFYKLDEVGFYFRMTSSKRPDQIFPLEPVVGQLLGPRARFAFRWFDDDLEHQRPLNIEVEVFAVNGGLQLGASQKVHVIEAKR